MALDSIYKYLASIPDKRTAQALTTVFKRFVPTNGENAGAVRNTMYQVLQAAYTVNPDTDNGKTFVLDAAAGFAVTLPPPTLGFEVTFLVRTAPTGGAYTVVTNGSANIIKGQAYLAANAAGSTSTAGDTISFVANQAVAGDEVICQSDGVSWLCQGFAAVAAGLTFTQVS